MPQLLRPPRPIPAPLEPSPPLDPVAMPSPPPPAPPAAAEDEERPWPPMKMKMLFPYAVNHVFGSMDRVWGMAMIGLHVVICIVKVLSFTTDPEEARFWIPIFRFWVYLGIAAMVVITCVDICYYMSVDGLYDPPQQQPAAAAEVQLPPPPPEMDMC